MEIKFWVKESNPSNDFVGLIFNKETVDVYLPIGFSIPSLLDQNKCIIDLIKAINLVKQEKSDKFYGDNKEENDIPIFSYLWLVEDYLAHGLYYDIGKTYKLKENGKINWKRTFKTKPIITKSNAIYLNLVAEKPLEEESIITNIEILCLKRCLNKLGWLFPKISLPDVNIYENDNYYIRILKSKLLNSYSDYKKDLLNNLIAILEDKSGNNNKLCKFGTEHFNVAWEKMLLKIYGNVNNEKFFPKSKYILDNGEFETSSLEPDIILENNNNLYILDAKYYKYGITGNNNHLPLTESIEKQINYAKYADSKYDYQNVYNAFILPFNKKETDDNIKIVGYAKSGSSTDNTYDKIAVILMDTKFVMDCYFNKVENELENLIKIIKRAV